ncbi:polysaccharide biosynthesis tyrosine autokinase [Komarekiella sp. 'clone 1']|uniref:non-specific protein-tyrosine kinase n=1 Tax=Komarekiella delphini-convector SJRDD-AB1 TaxID=2593771 RepID=A0AA40VR33_9NOST|nr:polysaccharide biosynthesis tyrosine autokinase [Komarekiella delphini-convector]MBD6616769.1 polysaccharide biosynthesis tyrosine autokinase [Komarekiella delphini-convector SJRDD-AB1]
MPSNQEEQNSFDLQQYLLILKKRWLVIAAVTGCVFGLSALAAFRQKPIYEAEGKLVFNKTDRVSSLTSPIEQLGELNSLTELGNPLDTEAEIIRSNPVVAKTIANLNLRDQQGKPLEIDQFLKKLKVKSIRGTDILAISYNSSNPQEAAAVVNSLMRYYLENNIHINQVEATAAKNFLSKQLPEVEVRVVRAETALRRFKEENRVVALEQEAATGVEKLGDLSEQITQAQANLVDVETRLKLLQRQLKLNSQQAIDIGNLSQSRGVQQVLTEYQQVQNELAVAQTRYTNQHPTIANLTTKRAALRKQLGIRVSQNLDEKLSVSEQSLQIGGLKQNLVAQLVQSNVERSALANRVMLLKNAYASSQKRLSVLPQLQQKQQQLERQVQVAQSTYEELLKRLQEVEVVNQDVGNARVVSAASLPNKDISPRIYLKLAVGGLLGIMLGVGTALLLEALDKSLNTVKQAKHLLGYRLLGTIPHLSQTSSLPIPNCWVRVGERLKGKGQHLFPLPLYPAKFPWQTTKGGSGEGLAPLPVRDNPKSAISSAFEMLQMNLNFTLFDKPLQVVAVVSSTPGEGRSFVAANLAIAKAHMGRRVLLMDADMRHSCQQEIWNLPNSSGLSDVLVGKGDFSHTVQQVLVNLDVLTVGTIPSHPAALLDSQRMALLIQEAAKKYDFVIIDTPALSLFADALMLSQLADGILLVVRPGLFNSATATATKTLLEQSTQHVLGMVINGVTFSTQYPDYYADKHYGVKETAKEAELCNMRFSKSSSDSTVSTEL